MRAIAPALEHPRGSAERAVAVKAAAGVPHLLDGELRGVAERTLYDWICQVETRGGAAVVPVPRADAGTYTATCGKVLSASTAETTLHPSWPR